MKKNIIINSILIFIAVLIPIRFEYLEYLRFVPSNAYYLKFYFPYFISLVILIIVLARIVKNHKKFKPKENLVPALIVITGIFIIWIIREKTIIIDYETIIHKNGLSYNSSDGSLLNGTYKLPSSWDGFGNDVHCSKMQYKNGVQVGKWMYSYKGDLIHSGEYLDEQELKQEIVELSKSSRVDINNWKEGDYPYLDIYLVRPNNTDSLTVNGIVKNAVDFLGKKYQFKSIEVSEIKHDTIIQLTHLTIKN